MRYVKGDWKYRVYERFTYETHIRSDGFELPFCSIDPNGLLQIERGYATDGPSGPTFDTKTFMRGAVVHDALYQLLRETPFGSEPKHRSRRKLADAILRDICLADGMNKWRAAWVYRGVRLGGGPAAAVKRQRVYVAP